MTNLKTLALLAGLGPAALTAQQVDSRWLPWLGCWQVAADQAQPNDLLVCVRPAENGVGIATLRGDEIASTRALVADGKPHALQTEGCSGSQFVAFSPDARRAYLWSTVTCEGGLKRTASAIMALASPTEWLDAQSLGSDGARVPRVVRYRLAPEQSWPAGFALSAQRAVAAAEARVIAAGRLSLADVREIASSVDQEALAAFLIERDQRFDLDAAQLATLADGGVPADVIDALVAVSYPSRFAIDRTALSAALKPAEQREALPTPQVVADPFGWGWWGYGRCYGGMGYWSPYCGSSLYWASGFGFGYMPYWYNPYNGYGYWGQPIITVVNTNQGRRGTVGGRGYSRGGADNTAGPYAHPRGGTAQTSSGGYMPSASSGSSSGSGSVSPGGYSRSGGSSSSGSSGTAKPKCCS